MVESSIKNFAESVSGQSMADELRELEITHVVTVPDTYQRTLLDLLYESRDIEVVTASTEDEAFEVEPEFDREPFPRGIPPSQQVAHLREELVGDGRTD